MRAKTVNPLALTAASNLSIVSFGPKLLSTVTNPSAAIGPTPKNQMLRIAATKAFDVRGILLSVTCAEIFSVGLKPMGIVKTKDGVEIYYKDWGSGQPIVFSHGWPLSADDWDNQMLFFLNHGYRVIAHDRRGHGRSSQVGDGHDMDHYADDLAAVIAHLDLKNAIHVGHSTGGGEVVHYLARHGESRVVKAAIISAVPPLMVQTPANPKGSAEGGIRRFAGAARGQPLELLPRSPGRALLWLQPAGRKALRGDHRELVAAGHDGRRQGALRRHRRLLADRFHRRPQEDHACRCW